MLVSPLVLLMLCASYKGELAGRYSEVCYTITSLHISVLHEPLLWYEIVLLHRDQDMQAIV